ncbi:MAG: TIGR00341 family protein [Parvularculaceae bacterium]|nr:TIGR00341 family protein [Parvularculaceae bacterium]
MRLLEAEFPESFCEQVAKYVELAEPVHSRISDADSEGRCVLRAIFEAGDAQELVDALQGLFEKEDKWRIVVLPVEATAPIYRSEEKEKERSNRKRLALREEILQDVSDGAALTGDFVVLTVLSTIVAAIGLSTNNIAVVIGAMVIAPLLGPVLAFAFGAAIGDLALVIRAARSAFAGLAIGFGLAFAVGAFAPVDFTSPELTSRTALGLDAVALALASGAAAALSISSGLSSALVGVMVAVALLPPSAAAGIFLGGGDFANAFRAALLLAVNVVCVNLAALAVFAYKGVKPRTWIEKISAARATRVNAGVLMFLLAVLVAAIMLG